MKVLLLTSRGRAMVILLVSLLVSLSSSAQEISINVSRQVLTNTKYITALIPGSRAYNAFDASVLWNTGGNDAAMYGFPRLGIGVSYSALGALDCTDGGKIGDTYSFYFILMRDLLHLGPVTAGYNVQAGAALMQNHYDRFNNPLNDLYGGPLTFHFKSGLYLQATLAERWRIGAEVAFKHNSAARLFIPNRGLNAMAYSISTAYMLGGRKLTPEAKNNAAKALDSPLRAAVFAAGGIHRCMAEFEADGKLPASERPESYTPWFKGSIGIEGVWRYCRKTSTGLQLELHYLSNTGALRRSDKVLYPKEERSYSPWAPGIAVIQDFYLGQFSAGVGLGAYLFRQVGVHEDHGRLYQKVNFRYYPSFLPSFFAGISLRVHEFSRADYFEFSVGKAFGRN